MDLLFRVILCALRVQLDHLDQLLEDFVQHVTLERMKTPLDKRLVNSVQLFHIQVLDLPPVPAVLDMLQLDPVKA